MLMSVFEGSAAFAGNIRAKAQEHAKKKLGGQVAEGTRET